MKYIRDTYGVPAKRGARIEFRGDGRLKAGTVVNSIGPYLRVRIDGGDIVNLHPTWEITWLDALSASTPPEEP